MFKEISWIVLVLLTISLLLIFRDTPNKVTAQTHIEPDNIVFILDNSGSMKEEDDTQRIKIDAAIDVVQRNIDNKSLLSTNMGLVVLGGDCKSKVLVGLSSGESNRIYIKSKLNSIDHRKSTSGSTPIVEAIDKALEILQPKKGNRRIVLISDGLPNCNKPNACDSVNKWDNLLQSKGINFDMEIIGYGIKQNNDKEFKCISLLSKRFSYTSVNNETQLKEAFKDSISKPFEKPGTSTPPISPSPTPTVPTSPSGDSNWLTFLGTIITALTMVIVAFVSRPKGK